MLQISILSVALAFAGQNVTAAQTDWDTASKAWVTCVTTTAADFAKQAEGADVVADAAFGACNELEAKARTAWEVVVLYRNSGKGWAVSASRSAANAEFDQTKAQARGIVIAQIMKIRQSKTPAR